MKYCIAFISSLILFNSCLVHYTTKDVNLDPRVKTARVEYFENKAGYVNPRLSQALTEAFRQKVRSQTRLTITNNDDAHYNISGYISDYRFTTAGVSAQQAATNRLNVTFHLIFKNVFDESKNIETDLNRTFDFDASLSITDAENLLFDDILKNMSDEIFNKIFSNW